VQISKTESSAITKKPRLRITVKTSSSYSWYKNAKMLSYNILKCSYVIFYFA